MTNTFRRAPRGLIASAAALSAMLLLATSSPSGAAGTAVESPTGWTKQPDSKELAGGAEHFRFIEDVATPGHPTRRELNVLRLDPAKGALRIESTVGASISGRESVRDQLKAGFFKDHPPLAGINGSYFLPEPKSGVPGSEETLAFLGVSARDGVLNSISCVRPLRNSAGGFVKDDKNKLVPDYGNQAVVLQYGVPYIARLKASVTLSYLDKDKKEVLGRTLTVGGVNRDPGRAPCAYDKATLNSQEETLAPVAKPAYTTANEIVLFHDGYDVKTPKPNLDTTPAINEDDAQGIEVSVGADGTMDPPTTGRGGLSVKSGGYVLQAIGQGATDLTAFVNDATAQGYTLKVTQQVEDMDHTKQVDSTTVQRSVDLDESVDIVSGIHRLLQDGETSKILPSCARLIVSASTLPGEGASTLPDEVEQEEDPTVKESDACLDARTVLGVDAQGRTVLATLTGPRDAAAGNPDGDFMANVAKMLKDNFEVIDAINFDGGGSTTMIVGGVRQTGRTDSVNHSPDGERPIADSVYAGNGGIAVK
ncbi:phosphodiester glycosidase family protein [Streptomyces sp. TBY4]|uniref:phosphodiester glycosidase family protein n=1 Tax=Streptomyces sp. TBY4 TaxID=2962030 RepID=UPI0020B6DCD3|nr:phosphodiester glycosidase family protein [Streptomyces sp. TBY4]MCP3756509.1 phosphodiester glycosidase family protein [Streptomyces sp. TBY4]